MGEVVDAARKPAQSQDRHSRQPGGLGALLRRLDSWPYLRTELRGDRVTLRMRNGDAVLGTLNIETRALTANVPAGMVGLLLADRPRLRGTNDGVSVHVTDVDSRRAAEALLRWRIELERFAPQLRNAAP
jgi:hypothetical protein